MLRNEMTEAAYDIERARLREMYGDSDREAVAKRDQALASLFARTGWTQERLAEKEGKSIAWVSCRLRFGRFMDYSTNVELPVGLTEGRFRGCWEQTAGSERRRFDAIAKLLQGKAVTPKEARKRREATAEKTNAVREAIRPLVEAGKTVNREEWADRMDVSVGTIQRATMQEIARLEILHDENKGNLISIHVLIEKLVPLFERVKEQSKRHVGLISTGVLLMAASEGQRLLDEWASGDETVRRVRGHVVPAKTPAEEKEVPDGCSLQADQQRDCGRDSAARC